ncbi:hypothetical protein DJ68_17420 [Halorubrum sp. C3]|nr:hypothetical protein DJ68_17420 [Halorubrum sp. C3]
MSNLRRVSDVGCRDIQFVIQMFGTLAVSIGFLLGSSLSWLLGGGLICHGIAICLLSRSFEPSRVEIQYDSEILS